MLIKFLMVNDVACRHIYLSDLMRFMREEEAVKAMDLFEGAKENNRVSKRALKNWVVREALHRQSVINILHVVWVLNF